MRLPHARGGVSACSRVHSKRQRSSPRPCIVLRSERSPPRTVCIEHTESGREASLTVVHGNGQIMDKIAMPAFPSWKGDAASVPGSAETTQEFEFFRTNRSIGSRVAWGSVRVVVPVAAFVLLANDRGVLAGSALLGRPKPLPIGAVGLRTTDLRSFRRRCCFFAGRRQESPRRWVA